MVTRWIERSEGEKGREWESGEEGEGGLGILRRGGGWIECI